MVEGFIIAGLLILLWQWLTEKPTGEKPAPRSHHWDGHGGYRDK